VLQDGTRGRAGRKPVSTAIITVTGTSCSTSTTVNGEAVDFTGYVVSSCP
jgi:hypothetical protein